MGAYLDKLNECYANRLENNFTFLVGDKGVGKTYTIDAFLKDKKNIFRVFNTHSSYYLDSIIDAVSTYTNKKFQISDRSLSMPDVIKMILIEIYKNKDSIIVFEGINSYDENLKKFCLSFLRFISCINSHGSFIIIELDSDFNKNDEKFLQELYSITIKTNFIKFKNRTVDELRTILFNSFENKLMINDEDLDLILRTSFGNIMRLFITINYLKQDEYIKYINNNWICSKLSNNILSQNVLNYVLNRYNALDDDLKVILQKSSILGIEFNSVQLSKSFNLLNADQELLRIERISSLIKKVNMKELHSYSFSPEEACITIQNLIPKVEKKLWFKMVAEYYELQCKKDINTDVDLFHLYYKIAICYRNGEIIEKAISYHFKAIRLCVSLFDYKQAINLLNSIKRITYLHSEYGFAYFEAIKWEAFCYKELGEYKLASETYHKLLHYRLLSSHEMLSIEYLYADMLYYIGNVSESKEILLKLKSKLEKEKFYHLLFLVMCELATVYGFLREYEIANEYYSRSLNLAKAKKMDQEYYVQIRKSSMFWDMEITIPLMKSALNYFQKNNNIIEISKISHNIGTDYLYLGNYDLAETYLRKAIEGFTSYASADIHYSYNCIGVYYATFGDNIEKAIKYFQKALFYEPVLFSQMVLNINISSCYYSIDDHKNAITYLEEALKIQGELGDDVPSYLIYMRINEALRLKLDNDKEASIESFLNCLDLKLNNNQLSLVGKNLTDLMDDPPEHILELGKIISDPLYEKFYSKNICLSTLRFWE